MKVEIDLVFKNNLQYKYFLGEQIIDGAVFDVSNGLYESSRGSLKITITPVEYKKYIHE